MGSEKSGAVMKCNVGLGLKMSAQQLPYDSGYGDLGGPTYCSSSGIAVPFTSIQMQELERQTMVYSYMKQSIPIPSELLFPIPKIIPSSSDHVAAAPKSNRMWDMGCMSNGKDPEPWRCRRTDGKKWRCSRDVVPDQKYCERHAHKNKPRSRKLVEQLQQSNISSINLTENTVTNINTRNLQQKPQFLNQMDHHHVSSFPSLGTSTTPHNQSRYSDWFTKGGTNSVSSSNQQWPQQQQSMHGTVGMKRDNTDCYKNLSVYDQEHHHEESMNFNDQCGLFLGSKFFIDAWPVTDRDGIQEMSNHNKRSVSSNGKMSVSSLTLSMPGDHITNGEDEEHGQMGNLKPPSFLNWMNPGGWMSSGSTPGGPLAEALCLGITSSAKTGPNPESPGSSYCKSPSGDRSSQGFNLM